MSRMSRRRVSPFVFVLSLFFSLPVARAVSLLH